MTGLEPQVPMVELKGISKSFGKVRANHEISLSIRAGKIKALLGENGAGKSTLMSILAGQIRPDAGRMLVDGVEVGFRSPRDAFAAGIGMVYQHFMLVESMTVAENVFLGQEKSFALNPSAMREQVGALAAGYKLGIDPGARVNRLSMGEKQRVEILKLLRRQSRVLIFDEPTAVLTPVESEQLFAAMRLMAEQGKAVVFISHKLPEVLAVADEVAILRRGELLEEFERSHVPDEAELARRMLGRDVESQAAVFVSGVDLDAEAPDAAGEYGNKAEPVQAAAPAVPKDKLFLEADGLSCEGVENISFSLARGDILAILGVAGNGQKQLVEAVCGLRRPRSGRLRLLGLEAAEFFARPPKTNGLAYIPEDRRGLGTCPDLNLAENFLLTNRAIFSRLGLLRRAEALKATLALIEEYDIRPGNYLAKARELSGGNLQKFIVGRELLRAPRLIVAENPTQGLDVAAAGEVWQRLLDSRLGSAVLLVTGDVNEALALADRIGVMYRGRMVDLFSARDRAKVSDIGLMMAGGR